MDNNRLDRLESKIDKVLEHVSSLDSTVAKQEVHLAVHIKRTEINEKSVAYLYKILIGALISGIGAILLYLLSHLVLK